MPKTKLLSSLFVGLPEGDHELMELVLKGKEKAFKKLFDKYKDQIFSFAYSYVKRTDAAEEITQETFMRVYKHAESYSDKYKFSTWIYTIARNLSLDYIKKKKELHLGASDEEEMGIEDFEDTTVNIEESLLEKSQKEMLRKCMEGLKDTQRDALTLRIFSEQSYAEIAETLRKTEKSIKSLINRAKENLTNCLKKCMEEAHE